MIKFDKIMLRLIKG